MNKKLGPIVLAMFIMSGCSLPLRLYPVQGPLSKHTPVPILNGTLTGNFSGTMKVVLPDGEICEGEWTASTTPPGSGSAIQPVHMAPVWDTIYGQGFYTAHILGEKVAQGTLRGNKGTTLSVEIKPHLDSQDGLKNIQGVAQDNVKNIYKIAL
jgi:hypothetical protein